MKLKGNVTAAFERIYNIGKTFDLEFHLPPFDGNKDEFSFDIDKFKETDEFQIFIGIINKMDIPYEYAKYKNKIFLTIKQGDMNGF